MSILGNDFLPSSLGLKIRDDGHSELIEILTKMINDGVRIINSSDEGMSNTINIKGVTHLFDILSSTEDARIYEAINKKMRMARNYGQNTENATIEIGDNNWPLAHIEEENIVNYSKRCLNSNWKNTYINKLIGLPNSSHSIEKLCADYIYGIQWIWDYYCGKYDNICFNWYYQYRLPPLWCWLKNNLLMNGLCKFPNSVKYKASDIYPHEQLCMVLPLESWELIPSCPQKKLPQIAPQFFPTSFTFDSVGKRFFWECESEIPLISISEVKALFNNTY
jgi:5'-3' exonuclease